MVFLRNSLLTIFIVLAVLRFCSTESSSLSITLVDQPLPMLELYDWNKKEIVSFNPPRPSLLVFFGSWCGYCIVETRSLMEVYRSAPVPFVGVAINDTPKGVSYFFLQTDGSLFSVVYLNTKSDDDMKGDPARLAFGIEGVPVSFILDSHGIIRYRISGVINAHNYEKQVLPLLKKMRVANDEKIN